MELSGPRQVGFVLFVWQIVTAGGNGFEHPTVVDGFQLTVVVPEHHEVVGFVLGAVANGHKPCGLGSGFDVDAPLPGAHHIKTVLVDLSRHFAADEQCGMDLAQPANQVANLGRFDAKLINLQPQQGEVVIAKDFELFV